jgi:hypothetical protein
MRTPIHQTPPTTPEREPFNPYAPQTPLRPTTHLRIIEVKEQKTALRLYNWEANQISRFGLFITVKIKFFNSSLFEWYKEKSSSI